MQFMEWLYYRPRNSSHLKATSFAVIFSRCLVGVLIGVGIVCQGPTCRAMVSSNDAKKEGAKMAPSSILKILLEIIFSNRRNNRKSLGHSLRLGQHQLPPVDSLKWLPRREIGILDQRPFLRNSPNPYLHY